MRKGKQLNPINPIPKELPKVSKDDLELLKIYLKEWETVINTQMHFNDLILRFRSITLTASIALVGAIVTIQKLIPLDRSSFLMVLAIIAILWITAFIIDFFYYHRLLLGAVAQARKFDENEKLQQYGMFGMTTCISESVHPPASKVMVGVYYFLPVLTVAAILYGMGF